MARKIYREIKKCIRCQRVKEVRIPGLCRSCVDYNRIDKLRKRAPLIECQCGCGTLIWSITCDRRPARFAYGHSLKLIQKKGSKCISWKGGRRIGSLGYVLIYMPEHPHANRHHYVLEHRIVMEKHLGRYLKKTEVVDHINRNRSDNRLENLRLFESNKEHMKAHWGDMRNA